MRSDHTLNLYCVKSIDSMCGTKVETEEILSPISGACNVASVCLRRRLKGYCLLTVLAFTSSQSIPIAISGCSGLEVV
jgi:hypothetical protein